MSGGVLRVGVVALVQRPDPYEAMDYMSGVICGQVFQPPYAFTEAGTRLHPVAFAGPLVRRGSVCVARLPEGAKFSDGSPVTLDDMVKSLRRQWTRDTESAVSAVGDELLIETRRAPEAVERSLVTSWCSVSKSGEGRVGTGAYMHAPSTDPDVVRLVRNPHYGGRQGRASIGEIEFRVFRPDEAGTQAALVQAIQAGEIDFTQVLSRDAATKLDGVRKLFQPGSSTSLLYLNTERLPDTAVRRAIAGSIDRYALAQACYENPAGFVARSVLPPRLSDYRDGIRRDPASREVLAKAGLGKLKLLVIWGPRPYNPKPLKVAKRIVEQLGEAGVEVEIDQAGDAETYIAGLESANYDMALTGWIADSGDPGSFLDALLSPGAIPDRNAPSAMSANISRWRNDEVVRRLASYHDDPTAEKCNAVLDLVRDEVPLLPLAYGPSVTVTAWRVRNFRDHPLAIYPVFAELELDDGTPSRLRAPKTS